MNEERKQAIEELKVASPLEVSAILKELELYDQESSQKIIDEIYDQFESGQDKENEIIVPIFNSIIDGLMEGTKFGRAAREKGLTASRVLQECRQFNYDGEIKNVSSIDSYTEYKNAEKYKLDYAWEKSEWEKNNKDKRPKDRDKQPEYKGPVNSEMSQVFDRKKYEDKRAMDGYKDRMSDGHSTVQDEYTGKKDLYDSKKNRPNTATDEKYGKLAETDHIVPLKQIHEEFKNNYALADDDIKRIANADYNLATTSAELNDKRGKAELTNSDFINKRKKEGNPLDEATKNNMLSLEKNAKKEIDKSANSAVIHNITGTVDKKALNAKYDALLESKKKAYEKKHGTKPSEDQIAKMKANVDLQKNNELQASKEIQKAKGKEIRKTAAKEATNQAKEYAVGNLILYIVKPLYFEMTDIMKNGLTEGVNASSTGEALSIRVNRIKKYLAENLQGFLGDNILEFVKGFISSLLSGIIELFVGILKQVLKVVREGIKIFTQSAEVLFGEKSKEMTPSQKGDAIIKILGGSVISIIGVGIDALLSKIGVPDGLRTIMVTILSGIASATFMMLLDKIDLFSVKPEKRRDRIIEIFKQKIQEIEEAERTFNITAIELLKDQRESFENIRDTINKGITDDNINIINQGMYQMANFMNVDLEYSNTEEFCDYMDSNDILLL